MNKDYIFLVTTYNCRSYIDACIHSLLIQDDDDFGIIFVDDASTDGTVERIRAISPDIKHEHIIHVNESRTGSAAWNQYQAVIKYVDNPNSRICILDGDDELYDNKSFFTLKVAEKADKRDCEAGVLQFQGRIPNTGHKLNLYREDDPYHLRYFNAWLYKAVPESMYYNGDELIRAASDIAFIYPVIQLLDEKFFMCNFLAYKWSNHLIDHNDHYLNLSEQRINLNYVKRREKMSALTSEQIQEIKDNWNS